MVTIVMPIVVPTRIHSDMTTRCIENLVRFTPSDMYRLVVIQGYEGMYGQYIRPLLREQDIYLGFKKNISQPKALNLGISQTDTKYICIFSNDCFVHQGWLEPILSALEAGVCDIAGPEWRGIALEIKKKYENEEYKTLHCSNFRGLGMNAPIMTRDTYKKVGRFDERLTRLFWDQDYALRVAKRKLRMVYCNDSQLTSLGTTTINYIEDELKRGNLRGIGKYSTSESLIKEAEYYKKKHPGEFV